MSLPDALGVDGVADEFEVSPTLLCTGFYAIAPRV